MNSKVYTDFNDLHVACGLEEVGNQIRLAISSVEVSPEPPKSATHNFEGQDPDFEQNVVVEPSGGAGISTGNTVQPEPSPEEQMEKWIARFCLIEGETNVWDDYGKKIWKKAAFQTMLGGKKVFDTWNSHSKRKTISADDANGRATGESHQKAKEMIERFIMLEERFTSYELKQVSQLTSRYATRLYELLVAWRSTGQTPVFEISEFRQQLGIADDEYTRSDNFKRRVLDIAISQINTFTDIKVKSEQHKTGRSISGYSFSFKPKTSVKNISKTSNEQLELIGQLTDKQILLFSGKLAYEPTFASKYSKAGESYDDFIIRIAGDLTDPKKIKEYSPYLKELGFK